MSCREGFTIKKIIITLTFLTLSLLDVKSILAESYPWRDHAPPFDFLFGNHIDIHQQSKILGSGALQGFFYIRFTGNFINGYPEAVHGQDTGGWNIRGIPIKAKLVELSPPTWCVDDADFPQQKGYTHFNWLGLPEDESSLSIGQTYNGYLMKLTARDTFFFGGFIVTPGIDFNSHNNIVTNCD
jgi:hypothetical protein